VLEGGAAQEAGIAAGDLIVALDGCGRDRRDWDAALATRRAASASGFTPFAATS